jgi:D-amino peptidase|tara:strand:- start:688 stop:1515 length:828 start_codon:yes stop_codon:yes gene_type:complete
LRIIINFDLEGVTGVVLETEQTGRSERFYEQSRVLSTGDINAVARGAVKAGVDEVYLIDSHAGWGQNLIFEKLEEEIRYLNGRSASRPVSVMSEVYQSCDAIFLVGLHPMRGTHRGVIEHTFLPPINVLRVNGVPMGEIGINAAIAGHFGVPIAFLSGCNKAVEESKAHFGDIETVEVKKGLGRTSAILLPPTISSKLLEESANRAVKRIKDFKPFEIKEPTTIEIEFQHTGMADAAEMTPFSKRVDGLTLKFEGPFLEAYKALQSMIRHASSQR